MNNNNKNPPQEIINHLKTLLNNRKFSDTFEKAETIIKQYPKSSIIWNILGVSLYELKKFDDAIKSYQKAVSFNPKYAHAYINLGIALRVQGKLDAAINVSNKAVLIEPHNPLAYNNLGAIFIEQGKFDEAIEVYKKVILTQPNYAEAHNNLGVALRETGKVDEAIEAYKKALTLHPDYSNAYSNLSAVLRDKGEFNEAIEACKKAISLQSDYAEPYYNLGVLFHDKGDFNESIIAYKKAISLQPDYDVAYNNLGNVFLDLGNLDEAIDAYKKSILIKPDYAEAHHNLSFTLLNTGKLKEGLDKYEWRWKTSQSLSQLRHFSKPSWDGLENLSGKTILLWCEQGIGDTLNWSSCLSNVTAQAKHCILECQEKLVPLLKRSFPEVEIKAENRNLDLQRDDFDFHLPMGSLYKHFLQEINKNIKPDAYLVPDPIRVEYWKERLKSLGKGPYIGIAWKSSVVSAYRRQHYPPISEWFKILSITDVTYINLQYKDFVDDLAKVKDKLGVTVHNFDDLDQYNNIDDVVALCAALDMAVTTKVTPMIFSSAVGTPTRIANLRQSIWNSILFNPVGPSIDLLDRNTWETWDNVFNLIAKDIYETKTQLEQIVK